MARIRAQSAVKIKIKSYKRTKLLQIFKNQELTNINIMILHSPNNDRRECHADN